MGEWAAGARSERMWFYGLLALAVLLRALNFSPFAMHHPDEVLQYLEAAYRLLGNEGIVPWEYRYGMRSWLLPWLLAGPMAIGQAIGGTSLSGIMGARVAAAAIGLIPIIAAWYLGRRLSPAHGIVAMGVMAFWYEQIVFSTHVLTESLATSLFLGGVALIDEKQDRRRLLIGGALLAGAVVFRFHYGVAAAVFALLALRNDWKRWSWLVAGAVPVLLLSGTVDLVMGQWPFEWVWVNVKMNLVEGRAAGFGVEEPTFFLTAAWGQWGRLTLPILLLAFQAGGRYRPLLTAALFNLAVHSAIGHKEYRFIELTSATLVLLAAIGSVNAWRWLEVRRERAFALPAVFALVALWAGASAWRGSGRPLDRWFGERSHGPELVYAASKDPGTCGLATMETEYWQLSRVYLGRPMPLILLRSTRRTGLERPGPELAAVNAVIAPSGSEAMLLGYAAAQCLGNDPWRRCLYRRPGPCVATPAAADREIHKILAKADM